MSAYGINPAESGMMIGTNPPTEECSQTLRKSPGGENGVLQMNAIGCDRRNQDGSDEVQPALQSTVSDGGSTVAIGFKAGQSKDGGLGDEREVSPTLSHKPSALEPTLAQENGVKCYDPYNNTESEVTPTIRSNAGVSTAGPLAYGADLSQMRYIVRRLTPTEAERLMGLPDRYLIPAGLRRFFDTNGEPSPELVSEFVDRFDTFNAIMAEYEHKKPPKGKSYNQVAAWLKKISDPATCPDSPMYKGSGNGWATNQPRWVLTRLLAIGEHIDPFTGEEL